MLKEMFTEGIEANWTISPLEWYKGTLDENRTDGNLCISSAKTYIVDNPLSVFRSLANAGSPYELRIVGTGDWRNPNQIVAYGDNDKRLLEFCEEYGLPTDVVNSSSTFSVHAWRNYQSMAQLVYPPEQGQESTVIGRADAGIRTTAALAYVCQTLVDLMNKRKWKDLRDKASVIEGKENQYTFLPHYSPVFTDAVFTLPDNLSLGESLSQGVHLTVLHIANWYLWNSLRVEIQTVASRPQLVQAAGGLRSYLWLHFALALKLTPFERTIKKICRDDAPYRGCGKPFYTTEPHRLICDDCKRRKEREKKLRQRKAKREDRLN